MITSEKIFELYNDCTLCPRQCHVNRVHGKTGVCKKTASLSLARAALHMWEEPCISGNEGSGTVFFSGCPLHCVYCQNHTIANGDWGRDVSLERLSEIFLELQKRGANNINLVTPTHYIPHIVIAVTKAKENGLNIPVVYNTSGYETPEALELLKGIVDIFLTDFRYYESSTAQKYSKAANYPEYAKASLNKMFELVGPPTFDEKTGLMKKGIIVRILVLPDSYKEAYDSVLYINRTFKEDVYLSILRQYTPIEASLPNGEEYDSLRRTITDYEYNYVLDGILELGIENCFYQEDSSVGESFIPEFDYSGI